MSSDNDNKFLGHAVAALQVRDFATAIQHLRQYAEKGQLTHRFYHLRGLAELGLGDWQAAVATFQEALTLEPENAIYWLNLAMARENMGQDFDAAESLERCLALDPKIAAASGNLANIYYRLMRFQEAEAVARQALVCGAPPADGLNSLGIALAAQGRFEEAKKCYDEALALAPDNALVYFNRANLSVDQLKLAEAWPDFATARTLNDQPRFRYDEGMARLLAGDYETGWHLYGARLELANAFQAPTHCPIYQGQPLAGKKLLLLSEQGFGDTIQFCRFGQLLAERGAELIWMIQPQLVRLLSGQIPGTVIAQTKEFPDADFYLPIMSLPLATDAMRQDQWPSPPTFTVPKEPQLPETTKRKIGLVWAGSPTHKRNHERTVPLVALASLWTHPRAETCAFYAPFIGQGLGDVGQNPPIIGLDHLIHDFTDTAALLRQLDLLITVDTAVAHLAGTLGVPTLLLLSHCPDWRWGVSGTTTPWYESVTLIRQSRYGDWESVVRKASEIVFKDY